MSGGITLAALLGTVAPEAGVFIVHQMGEGVAEGVGGGTAAELLPSDVVKKVGGNAVKRITLDVDEWPETPTPTLIVTIGDRERRRGRE